MKVALLGTCRLLPVRRHFDCTGFDQDISYVHSTKEILQLLWFITKQIEIPDAVNRFCFRTSILNHRPVPHSQKFVDQFNAADLFVVEVCAQKKYMFDKYVMHHLAVDQRLHYYRDTPKDVRQRTVAVHQGSDEIDEDIDKIVRLVHPRRVLVVSHFNAMVNMAPYAAVGAAGKTRQLFGRLLPFARGRETAPRELTTIKKRADLIRLLGRITEEKNLPFFDPTVTLKDYSQESLLQEEAPGLPPGHYTDFGAEVVGRVLAGEINRVMG